MYHIHYRPRFQIGKPDGLPRDSREEKFGIHINVLDAAQLLELENDNYGEGEHEGDVAVEGINVVTSERKNRLRVLLQDSRFEILPPHHYSQESGHC